MRHTSKIVLYIDDKGDLLDCEKEFLESFGYTVLTARSGGKALKLASINPVDVVVVDYYLLPGIYGQEFAIQLASHLLTAIAQLQDC